MIHSLSSTLSSFKTLTFGHGLNVVLADRSAPDDSGRTRNGAGKSSLVELVSLILGGSIRRHSVVKADELNEEEFVGRISFKSTILDVRRSASWPSVVHVDRLDDHDQLRTDEPPTGSISIDEWRNYLGKAIFGLRPESERIKYAPTFRSLFTYFVRPPSGFDTPEKTFPQASKSRVQGSLSYLLKLDWKIACEFEQVRQEEAAVRALKKAANQGSLSEIMGSASEIRSDILVSKRSVDRLEKNLAEFRVLPEYREYEQRANDITKELGEISSKDSIDREWLSELLATIEEEVEPTMDRVDRLFRELSKEMPDLVKRRFDEVEVFHKSIVKNRREHLQQEINEIRDRIAFRNERKQELDSERAEIMQMLHAHGALDQHNQLQERLSEERSRLEQYRRKLEVVENLEGKRSQVKIERQQLLRRLRLDYSDREEMIERAVITFSEISEQLFDEPGRLTVEPTENGPEFRFDIPAKKSIGKGRMQVFCFDMMLMKLWSDEERRPETLVHDSHIFDGVDERQVARALEIGGKMADRYGFQYIVTMNSDVVPRKTAFNDIDISDHVVEGRIDDTRKGGLFGIRFEV